MENRECVRNGRYVGFYEIRTRWIKIEDYWSIPVEIIRLKEIVWKLIDYRKKEYAIWSPKRKGA